MEQAIVAEDVAKPWAVAAAFDRLDVETATYSQDEDLIELMGSFAWARLFEARVGGRVSASSSPVGEGFLGLRLAPRTFGAYCPSLGLELGYSGVSYSYSAAVPSGGYPRTVEGPSPLYLGVASSPLSFQFGRIRISALGLFFGTSFTQERDLRVRVDLLSLGVAL